MSSKTHPTDSQRQFLQLHVLGEEATILTLKVRRDPVERRGFAVNVRGPFDLVQYAFKDSETVIDATWARRPGEVESLSHLHVSWPEVRFARLSETNAATRENIGYQWQLDFFASKEDASTHDPAANDRRLFSFYLKDDTHKGVQNLKQKQGEIVPVA